MKEKVLKIQKNKIPVVDFYKFRGKEVALVNGKVVAEGKTPKEALEKAKEKRVERPTLLQAIPDYSGFVPFKVFKV